MEFRKRLYTDHIYVVKTDLNGATRDQLYKAARRAGELDTVYHYILHNDGTVEIDRQPNTCVAQYNFENANTSVYILADCKKGKLSDAQRIILVRISKEFPTAEVHEVTND